jgi:hypothetical protein
MICGFLQCCCFAICGLAFFLFLIFSFFQIPLYFNTSPESSKIMIRRETLLKTATWGYIRDRGLLEAEAVNQRKQARKNLTQSGRIVNQSRQGDCRAINRQHEKHKRYDVRSMSRLSDNEAQAVKPYKRYKMADPADSFLAFSILQMAAIYYLISCACYDRLICYLSA